MRKSPQSLFFSSTLAAPFHALLVLIRISEPAAEQILVVIALGVGAVVCSDVDRFHLQETVETSSFRVR